MNTEPIVLDRCPNCGSFVWFFDDTALAYDDDGAIVPDVDVCHCEDCDHMWAVPALDLGEDDDDEM